ncbi:MAG: VOC family protein [Marmoricola sp.]
MTANTALFLTLRFKDALTAIDFLRDGLGFEPAASHPAEDDATRIEHAQMNWPGGGGIMFGSSDDPEQVGHARAYLVLPTDDDVDRVHARALAHGATSVREPEDMDYGGRGSTVADPEGNHWSLGSYRGQ